jgi:hypothetical protein
LDASYFRDLHSFFSILGRSFESFWLSIRNMQEKNLAIGSVEGEVWEIWETIFPKSSSKPLLVLGSEVRMLQKWFRALK